MNVTDINAAINLLPGEWHIYTNKPLSTAISVEEIEYNSNELLAYPNPFYNTFSLNYRLESPSNVQIRILDTSGKEIAVKNKTEQSVGVQQVEFTFESDIPPGLYTALISYSGKT